MSQQDRLKTQLEKLHLAERKLASTINQQRLGCGGEDFDRELRKTFRQAERQVRRLEKTMMNP